MMETFVGFDYFQDSDAAIKKKPETPAGMPWTLPNSYIWILPFGWRFGASQLFFDITH